MNEQEGGSVTVQEELTLEQLHGITTDPESEKKVAQSLQVPVGTYNSVPELTMTLGKAKASGRAYARYFGAFTGTGEVAEQQNKRLGFAVSWEPRFKDDTGRADLMTKLFHDAKATYRRAHELDKNAQVTVGAVLEFIKKYAVAIRFIQGEQDNMAVAITTAKE